MDTHEFVPEQIDCPRCAANRRRDAPRPHNPARVAIVIAVFGVAWAVAGGVVIAMIVGVL